MKNPNSLLATLMIALAGFLFIPSGAANAAHDELLPRVNEAIRTAGVKVTVARSNAFQVGIVNGHYTSFDQLVGAIQHHKAAEALPNFTSATPHSPADHSCLTGVVLSISDTNMTLRGDDEKGNAQTITTKLSVNQYDVAIERGVKAGEVVKTCSVNNFTTQYGHATVVE